MITLRKPIAGDIEARQKLGRHPDVMRGFGIFKLSPAKMLNIGSMTSPAIHTLG
jgi:hypothetical protein